MTTLTEHSPLFPDWLSACLSVSDAESASPPDEMLSKLIEHSRSGSHDSYRKLVEIYQERIFRFCRGWVGSVEDAEEICQDTFVKAYSALPRYRSTGQFSAWLYRIARNQCHDHHRSRSSKSSARNRSLEPGDHNTLISPCHPPDAGAVRSEELQRLESQIARLPPHLREVIILSAIEGLRHAECAVILKCSIRTVEGRLYRARLQLLEWRTQSAL